MTKLIFPNYHRNLPPESHHNPVDYLLSTRERHVLSYDYHLCQTQSLI